MTEKLSDAEQKIISVATRVFLQKGKDGARMQEIADQAGINKALLHYYFRNKDRLYRQVFRTQVRTFFQELLGAVPETDDVKVLLERFVESYIDALARHPEIVRFVLWEIQKGGELFSETAREVFREQGFSRFPFVEKIQAAIRAGQIRAADPLHLVISVIGLCVYPFIAQPIVEKMLPEIKVNSSKFLAQRKREVCALLWSGIAPE